MRTKKIQNYGFCLEDEIRRDALVINDLDVTLGELAKGFIDNSENVEGGVFGWNGKVCFRPKFQRNYVVDGNFVWQASLVNSVLNSRPIGLMYFGDNGSGVYQNIDGQQRLITLCSFINGDLTLKMMWDGKYKSVNFENIPEHWQEKIRNYRPEIKVCKGSNESILQWFITVNQPTFILTNQELRNAAYSGEFVESVKRIFAVTKKTAKYTVENGKIMDNESKYCYSKYGQSLEPDRQDVVEMALDWVSSKVFYGHDLTKDQRIESYMNIHKNDDNAKEVLDFYVEVIDWVHDIFFHGYTPKLNKWQSVRSQKWNEIYLKYKDSTKNMTEQEKIHITNRCKDIVAMGAALYNKAEGIYEWVLRGEKDDEINIYLHLRGFKEEDRLRMYNSQGGIDPINGKYYEYEDMECHHIVPWKNGGLTDYDNLVMLSKESHKNIDITGLTPEDVRELRDKVRRTSGHIK